MTNNWKHKIGENGRHLVHSLRTGKTYVIEPIKPSEKYRVVWGDVDPASNKVTGEYGVKHDGAVTEKDSIITEENGFKNITVAKGSPYWEVEKLDSKYPDKND